MERFTGLEFHRHGEGCSLLGLDFKKGNTSMYTYTCMKDSWMIFLDER